MDHRHPISAWRQQGYICFWTFDVPRAHNFAGWHFNADAAGCDSLLTLLALVKESGEPIYRTLELAASQSRVVGENRLRARCPQKLKLSYSPDRNDDCAISEEASVLAITFGSKLLREFSDSVGRVKSGDGDFSIRCGETGKKHGDLWFWWWLNA